MGGGVQCVDGGAFGGRMYPVGKQSKQSAPAAMPLTCEPWPLQSSGGDQGLDPIPTPILPAKSTWLELIPCWVVLWHFQ